MKFILSRALLSVRYECKKGGEIALPKCVHFHVAKSTLPVTAPPCGAWCRVGAEKDRSGAQFANRRGQGSEIAQQDGQIDLGQVFSVQPRSAIRLEGLHALRERKRFKRQLDKAPQTRGVTVVQLIRRHDENAIHKARVHCPAPPICAAAHI